MGIETVELVLLLGDGRATTAAAVVGVIITASVGASIGEVIGIVAHGILDPGGNNTLLLMGLVREVVREVVRKRTLKFQHAKLAELKELRDEFFWHNVHNSKVTGDD